MKHKKPQIEEVLNTIPPSISELPSTAILVEGRDDKGKKVIINSISGALVNATGVIVAGPFTFNYRRNKEDKGIKKRGPIVNSEMYWRVLVDNYNLYLDIVEKEFKVS